MNLSKKTIRRILIVFIGLEGILLLYIFFFRLHDTSWTTIATRVLWLVVLLISYRDVARGNYESRIYIKKSSCQTLEEKLIASGFEVRRRSQTKVVFRQKGKWGDNKRIKMILRESWAEVNYPERLETYVDEFLPAVYRLEK